MAAKGKNGGKLGRRAIKARRKARAVPVVTVDELDGARDFVNGKKGVSAENRKAYALGELVKVTSGDWASSRGRVESITPGGVTVRVHARLAVIVPAAQLEAV